MVRSAKGSRASVAMALVGALIALSTFVLPTLAAVRGYDGRPIEFGRRAPFGGKRPLMPREVTGSGNAVDGQTYDYIIVGGGLAGLTVANRISEDPSVSVLVIEAGGDIYGANQNTYLVPASNLYQSAVGTDADWQWQTTSQAGLGGRTTPWPRGKVLGGSSSINGLYMVRASQIEHDAWGALISDPDRWGWNSMLAAMKKSENFSAPTNNVQQTVPSLKFNAGSHGIDGPVHVGWPAVSYNGVEAFLQACEETGTEISNDPDNGQSWGAFYATSAIDPSNWQRSSSRTAYLNGADQRPNLTVLINNQVTKVLTNGTEANGSNVTATGVQFAAYSGATVRQAFARREVILSGGAINSPMLLQLSGIGDAQQLQNLGIDSLVDLPGVGHNIQDHIAVAVTFSPGSDAQQPAQSVTGNARQDSYVNAAIAYVNVTTLFGAEEAQNIVQSYRSNLNSTINNMNAREEVKESYRVTTTTQINDVFSTAVGPVELLFAYSFGSLQVQVALQHPLSRGSILINSQDPFASPSIDAGYLAQDIDLQLLREGAQLARRIGQTQAMSGLVGSETAPGTNTQSNGDWNTWIRANAATEYHPSSGCSMLPRNQGGVVDSKMLVYGTNNLRVIDSSVPPLAVSAHLMTITYGLAEIGAEIINEARNPPSTQNNANNNGTGSGSGSSSGQGSNGSKNGSNGAAASFGRVSSLVSTLAFSLLFCTASLLVLA